MERKKMKISIKRLLIAVCVVLVLGVGVGVTLFLTNNKMTQAKIESQVVKFGGDFYENFYYKNITADNSDEKNKAFLERFKDTGLKVNLDNLGRYHEGKNADVIRTFINPDTKLACDINNTRAVIYPKAPYGIKDYDVKAEVDCGFADVKQ